jgi:hypothetical protein
MHLRNFGDTILRNFGDTILRNFGDTILNRLCVSACEIGNILLPVFIMLSCRIAARVVNRRGAVWIIFAVRARSHLTPKTSVNLGAFTLTSRPLFPCLRASTPSGLASPGPLPKHAFSRFLDYLGE